MGIKTTFAALLCVGSLVGSGAMAQSQSKNRVAQKTKWSVFVEDNPTECWSVSAPEETVNSRDGRVVAATRSQILLMVFYRPSEVAKGQIAFTGGRGAAGALQVPRKGVTEYAVDGILHYLDLWGLVEVVLKSDTEASIVALLEAVRLRRKQPTMLEHSPKGDHQSNGDIESEIYRLEAQTRTVVSALEDKLGITINAKSVVIPCAVRHAAFCLTRFAIEAVGRPAW